ncbi:PEPxxWA-CTERM sorting domain-containing protein [Phenylobacterium sp. LjRoot164]
MRVLLGLVAIAASAVIAGSASAAAFVTVDAPYRTWTGNWFTGEFEPGVESYQLPSPYVVGGVSFSASYLALYNDNVTFPGIYFGASSPLTITPSERIGAFRTSIGSYQGTSSMQIEVNGVVIADFAIAEKESVSFAIVSDEPISQIRFIGWGGAEMKGFSISSAIPEPATWAMMIVGLGLSGAVLRRRRGAVVGA